MLAPRPALLRVLGIMALVTATDALALQAPPAPKRFEGLVRYDPSATAQVASLPAELLPSDDPLQAAWKSFNSLHGKGWRVYLDRRSGAPLLAQGPGIPWIAGSGNSLEQTGPVSLESLEQSLRGFIRSHAAQFRARDEELVLDRDASGRATPDLWQVIFRREVSGVPVSGDRYLFYISHGNLIAFGASRWTPIVETPKPMISASAALSVAYGYMGLSSSDVVKVQESGTLVLMPTAVERRTDGPYKGPLGAGYVNALVWRQVVRVEGVLGTWVVLVDARDGNVLAFYDDNKYAEVKGGVYPESPDGICPTGCEQADYPMPFADIKIQGAHPAVSDMGIFSCTPSGSAATTTLSGPFVNLYDYCGSLSEAVTCDNDLDLGVSSGKDCAVPTGSSPGNNHAARTSFYHLNRMAEKARSYLPSRPWLSQSLGCVVNIPFSCNSYWDGDVNFYRSSSECNNTGEIPGVIQHEWGHGLDRHDGGGYDNPTEGYADITEFLEDHTSCIGRGFRPGLPCDRYGNPCLECTGFRDMDWDKRQDRTPSSPMGLSSYCPSGEGPCLLESHCEGALVGETLWDLATRDLTGAGVEQATAWQLVQDLWYRSRLGSGGNAYNCSLPSSDGCGAGSWFTRLRIFDDDDGNLGNGTPHAAAIYAAFKRHEIACGEATDPSNQSTTSCPVIGTPTLTASAGIDTISLSWAGVPDSATYVVLRNEFGCSYSFSPIRILPGLAHTDEGLASRLTYYYRVQAVGQNSACAGPVSGCLSGQLLCVDADGDGFGSSGRPSCSRGPETDCDDSNATIYPGAIQLCDGQNNDCNTAAWPELGGTNEADNDGDGLSACAGDCNDADTSIWAIPGAAESLLVSSDDQTLSWSAPTEPGGAGSVFYDTIRSNLASDFMTDGTCIETDDGSDLQASDPDAPPIGQVFHYLVRGRNSCGEGGLGTRSDGQERIARSCP